MPLTASTGLLKRSRRKTKDTPYDDFVKKVLGALPQRDRAVSVSAAGGAGDYAGAGGLKLSS